MRKSFVLLLVLFFLIAICTIVAEPAYSDEMKENSWTTKAPMPEAMGGVKAAVVNEKIYVMTGSYNYEYDPATNNWTAKKSMPTPRPGISFAIAAYQNKIYVIGGNNGSSRYVSTNEVYDPATDTWETKKPMPTSREQMEANVVNGKIYVIGGVTDNYRSITIPVNEVYDPATDSWTTKKPAPIAAHGYISAVVDNKIYLMAGVNHNTSLNWVFNQVYDTETDAWSLGAPLPAATYYAAAVATTGAMAPKRIYVIGGGFTNTSNTVRVYDPSLDAWSSGAPMPTNRSDLAGAAVNDLIYAIGGSLGWYGGDWPYFGYSLSTDVVEQYIPFEYGTIPQPTPPEPVPFPVAPVAAASVATVAVVGVGLLIYFKKRKH